MDISLIRQIKQLKSSQGHTVSAWQRESDRILRPILKEVSEEIRTLSGCQSIGIMLQNGEDYPYYLHQGFPEFFILKENSLCTGDNEEALYSDDSAPLLA